MMVSWIQQVTDIATNVVVIIGVLHGRKAL